MKPVLNLQDISTLQQLFCYQTVIANLKVMVPAAMEPSQLYWIRMLPQLQIRSVMHLAPVYALTKRLDLLMIYLLQRLLTYWRLQELLDELKFDKAIFETDSLLAVSTMARTYPGVNLSSEWIELKIWKIHYPGNGTI